MSSTIQSETAAGRPQVQALRAALMEVFASIQGEGLYVGQPQVFVRLAGCPLRCEWCDTPGSWSLPKDGAQARLDLASGREQVASYVTAQDVAGWVEAADPGGNRPLSLTGGEPLMWPEFIIELRAAIGSRRLHLETAGAFPATLARVIDALDHISADLKAPRDLRAPVPLAGQREAAPADEGQWRLARRALLAQLAGRDACLKLVWTGDGELRDLRPLLEDQAELARDLPLFIQPLTPTPRVPAASALKLHEVTTLALSLGLIVRVVPQVHRLLGMP